MKYYSEITKKVYDTVSELKAAECQVQDRANARKKDAEVVEKAFNNYRTARAEYEKAMKDFCDKYGSYHRTIKMDDSTSESDDSFASLKDLVNLLF